LTPTSIHQLYLSFGTASPTEGSLARFVLKAVATSLL